MTVRPVPSALRPKLRPVLRAVLAASAWLVVTASAAPPGSSVTLVDARADGQRLTEVSGLAWDVLAQHLYAVSDRGLLYQLRRTSSADQPLALELLHAHPLKAPDGRRLDAEGLELLPAAHSPSGQTELLVASEGPARVLRYSTDGELLGEWALPAALAGSRALRRGNSQLEAVAMHPRLGLLVAAEAPTPGSTGTAHEVHSPGRSWRFATGHGGRQLRLKAMDVLPDGRLLVLERARGNTGGAWVNRLLELDLERCGGITTCQATERLVLEGKEDAANHEGMALLVEPGQHAGPVQTQVLLVSDDRGERQQGTRFQLLTLP